MVSCPQREENRETETETEKERDGERNKYTPKNQTNQLRRENVKIISRSGNQQKSKMSIKCVCVCCDANVETNVW